MTRTETLIALASDVLSTASGAPEAEQAVRRYDAEAAVYCPRVGLLVPSMRLETACRKAREAGARVHPTRR
jgi:hypothetical protein